MDSLISVFVYGRICLVNSELYTNISWPMTESIMHYNLLTSVIWQCRGTFAPWGEGGANQAEPIRAGASFVPDIWRNLMKGNPTSMEKVALASSKLVLKRARCSCCNNLLIFHQKMASRRHCSRTVERWIVDMDVPEYMHHCMDSRVYVCIVW